jgi:hypothetical protein
MVEAVHAPIVPEVPVDVKVWRETQTNADAVKGILVTLLGIKVAAAGNVVSSPPNQIDDAAMLPKESQAALNIGLERSNGCLEGFIHGWCEQRLTTQAQRPGPRDAAIATVMRWPGSLQRMVRPLACHVVNSNIVQMRSIRVRWVQRRRGDRQSTAQTRRPQ